MSDKIIWQSARNILDTVNSLEALGDVVGRSIMETFQGNHVSDDGWGAQGEHDDWIEPMFVRNFSLKRHKKSNAKITRCISIGFQLTSDASELEWNHGQRAKLLVASSETDHFAFGTSFPNAGGEAEDMTDDEAPERYSSDGFRWIGERCGDWFYAVPLDALKSEADVQRLVANPLARLIGGDASEAVLGPIKDKLCLPPQHQELSAEAS
ncbi:hypothetical protein [Paracoccus sp. DMF]|uniref:hypothetical protein n=1 Tax=Paracoccus sp. DMF TaxID=400837 RepID=UPI0010FFF34D|nr:hypothetical protein [Paracoccus sp. DMF]MCV2449274.1 hypothetical protein [Paracoccus sp. DMF]